MNLYINVWYSYSMSKHKHFYIHRKKNTNSTKTHTYTNSHVLEKHLFHWKRSNISDITLDKHSHRKINLLKAFFPSFHLNWFFSPIPCKTPYCYVYELTKELKGLDNKCTVCLNKTAFSSFWNQSEGGLKKGILRPYSL